MYESVRREIEENNPLTMRTMYTDIRTTMIKIARLPRVRQQDCKAINISPELHEVYYKNSEDEMSRIKDDGYIQNCYESERRMLIGHVRQYERNAVTETPTVFIGEPETQASGDTMYIYYKIAALGYYSEYAFLRSIVEKYNMSQREQLLMTKYIIHPDKRANVGVSDEIFLKKEFKCYFPGLKVQEISWAEVMAFLPGFLARVKEIRERKQVERVVVHVKEVEEHKPVQITVFPLEVDLPLEKDYNQDEINYMTGVAPVLLQGELFCKPAIIQYPRDIIANIISQFSSSSSVVFKRVCKMFYNIVMKHTKYRVKKNKKSHFVWGANRATIRLLVPIVTPSRDFFRKIEMLVGRAFGDLTKYRTILMDNNPMEICHVLLLAYGMTTLGATEYTDMAQEKILSMINEVPEICWYNSCNRIEKWIYGKSKIPITVVYNVHKDDSVQGESFFFSVRQVLVIEPRGKIDEGEDFKKLIKGGIEMNPGPCDECIDTHVPLIVMVNIVVLIVLIYSIICIIFLQRRMVLIRE